MSYWEAVRINNPYFDPNVTRRTLWFSEIHVNDKCIFIKNWNKKFVLYKFRTHIVLLSLRLGVCIKLACPIAVTYSQLLAVITLPNCILELILLYCHIPVTISLHYSTLSSLRTENLSYSCLHLILATYMVPGTTWY